MDWLRHLESEIFDNSLRDWLYAAAAFLLVFVLLPALRRFIDQRRRRWDSDKVPDGIELAALLASRTSFLVVLSVAAYIAVKTLKLPLRVHDVFEWIIIVTLWLQVGIWASAAVGFAIDRYYHRRHPESGANRASTEVLRFLARLVVYSAVLLLALENLGVNITTLLTGLGIGGIAVALAVQNVLGDLLASLSITLDKPFEVGDSLAVGDEVGTVEHIGVKSTRLRSLDGEQIIIPNADLLKSRIRNFKRMLERRHVFKIGIVYETPIELVQQVTGVLEEAVRLQPGTRFARAHFVSFGDSALQFETAYYILDPDYARYADTQQAINLRILGEFQRLGIEFAYPTQRHITERRAVTAQ